MFGAGVLARDLSSGWTGNPCTLGNRKFDVGKKPRADKQPEARSTSAQHRRNGQYVDAWDDIR